MTQHTGNLTNTERAVSAAIGLTLAAIAGRRGNPLLRTVSALASGAMFARSYTGYCGVKAALVESRAIPLSGVDSTVNDSFPASDPPASHLPDEPPVNAQAKWDAARAAPQG